MEIDQRLAPPLTINLAHFLFARSILAASRRAGHCQAEGVAGRKSSTRTRAMTRPPRPYGLMWIRAALEPRLGRLSKACLRAQRRSCEPSESLRISRSTHSSRQKIDALGAKAIDVPSQL